MALTFFNSNQYSGANQVRAHKPGYLSVGTQTNCAELACAVGILDNALNYPHIHPGLIRKFLGAHAMYFRVYDKHVTTDSHQSSGLIKPYERLMQLAQVVSMPKLASALSYTLRQMAVDGWVENLEAYWSVFVDNHHIRSPEELRKPSTWLDVSMLEVLAEKLSIPIKVNCFQNEILRDSPQLPQQLKYNATAFHPVSNPWVTLELRSGHYRPWVASPEVFSPVATLPSLVVSEPVKKETEANEKIHRHLNRLVKRYQQIYEKLHSALYAQGSLTDPTLLNEYVQSIRVPAAADSYTVGVDNQRQLSLERLLRQQTQYSPMKTQIFRHHLLMDGVAKAVCLQSVEENTLLERLVYN